MDNRRVSSRDSLYLIVVQHVTRRIAVPTLKQESWAYKQVGLMFLEQFNNLRILLQDKGVGYVQPVQDFVHQVNRVTLRGTVISEELIRRQLPVTGNNKRFLLVVSV